MTFPADSYTPFGYLANPFHRARSWSEVEAGMLRTSDRFVGFGWVEPTARKPIDEGTIVVVVRWNDRVYRTRSDFSRLGLASRHHTSALFSFDWKMDSAEADLSFALASRDSLVAELRIANPGALPFSAEVIVLARVRAARGGWSSSFDGKRWILVNRSSKRVWSFDTATSPARFLYPDDTSTLVVDAESDGGVAVGFAYAIRLIPGDAIDVGFGFDRSANGSASSTSPARRALDVCRERRADDDAFYAGVALPVGDWPDSWKRGWIYDLETTRACIYPPGGIFKDEWLSWMVSWPRVVIAEGTLDAARFSYADPVRALRLALSLFENAPAPNVPCVFQGGEQNMVAKDGTVCGTSPAWCLPFHNLQLLYSRTLDRGWLEQLVPFLEAYLEYWLTERTDEDGWVVYKCTWEAGEDCTPRLDPLAEGDQVISRWVRPVELQATLSQSAAILASFFRDLGKPDQVRRWDAVAATYAQKTQQLWDGASGRFRDLDRRTGTFLESPGDPTYWKTDPVRFSALSLTPIVAGLADPEQLTRLATEIEYYNAAPWCLWPSWSFVVGEAATAAGWFEFGGRFANRIVDRVYLSNDRRSLADANRPTPGTSPEFWPLDLAEFNGSDGYGWGASTTSLWVRQVFGFLESESSADVTFRLAPSLPPAMLAVGRRFGFVRMPYRGWRLDLSYEVTSAGLIAVVGADRPFRGSVVRSNCEHVLVQSEAQGRSARFSVAINDGFLVSLVDAEG